MPESYRITIMPRAAEDLAGICDYISQDSPQAAADVAHRLLDAIDSLEVFPYRHKVHRWRRAASRVIRSMPVSPFIIYYRVFEKHRTVEIVTVWHGKREQPTAFD